MRSWRETAHCSSFPQTWERFGAGLADSEQELLGMKAKATEALPGAWEELQAEEQLTKVTLAWPTHMCPPPPTSSV